MVPHASLPQSFAPSTTMPAPSGEESGLLNRGYETPEASEMPEVLQTLIEYNEVDPSSQGNAPKKKAFRNGAARHAQAGGDPDLMLTSLDEANSLTEPLLSDEDREAKPKSNNNNQKASGGSGAAEVVTPTEASWQVALQVFFPYVIAGLGMVAAGIVLDIVQVRNVVLFVSWYLV